MTKTCVKCQAQFETEDMAKIMCPVCEAAEKPAETVGQPPVEPTTPASEAPTTENPTPTGDNTQPA